MIAIQTSACLTPPMPGSVFLKIKAHSFGASALALLALSWFQLGASAETSNGSSAGGAPIAQPARSEASPQPLGSGATGSTNNLRSFSGQGIVQDLPDGGKSVLVKHEAIAGFMPKMTMEFSVRDSKELKGLMVGDSIAFVVKANEEESWIEGIHKTTAITSLMPRADKPLTELAHIGKLKSGDLLPDAELLDENGRPLHFSDFRGRAVAFTFIFTRCPLPDFCPRMSRRFGEARDLLLEQTPSWTNWEFLSISFDPEFDQPAVLKGYAMNYRGQSSDRWLFASASTNVTAALASEIDFRLAREEGSFVHNLRTVVLDSSGHIFRQFDGNRWQAEELAQAVREAAALGPGTRQTKNAAAASPVRAAHKN